uniref:Uncharacterized protein n=1 Tax=Trichobilharzia regenti TaxID=157069 RepID=A0AA85IUV3_TRIRE|nr:unnamed protein product [Trichobilharzia regenti]
MSTNCKSLPNKSNHLHSPLYSNVYCNTGVITLQETWFFIYLKRTLYSIFLNMLGFLYRIDNTV